LIRVLARQPTLELGVHAVMASGRQAPAKVRAFMEFLHRRFMPHPAWDKGLA
jgi:DNA-binding transcriptional LysR family regulator